LGSQIQIDWRNWNKAKDQGAGRDRNSETERSKLQSIVLGELDKANFGDTQRERRGGKERD
jgi:hypothetical protein